jgi:hypothetical protein
MSGGQVTQPNFMSMQGPQTANTDYAGIAQQGYANQMAGYNAQQQMNPMGGIIKGLFGLGNASIMASDERLKENIEPVGAEVEGMPVYEYNYKADPSTRHVGIMAQDALKKRPDVVVKMGKYLGVNYGKL